MAGVAGAAVVGGALGLARRPRVAWLVAVAALLAVAPYGASFGVALLVAAHGFCAGRWAGRWVGLLALAPLVGALEVGVLVAREAGVPALLIPAAGWGAGRALRERELVAAQLAERVRELEEEREAHAALPVRYERARIASELRDIVAHAISVMVVQASAGQRLAARDPEATAEGLLGDRGCRPPGRAGHGPPRAARGRRRDRSGARTWRSSPRASGSGLDVTLRFD